MRQVQVGGTERQARATPKCFWKLGAESRQAADWKAAATGQVHGEQVQLPATNGLGSRNAWGPTGKTCTYLGRRWLD